MSPQVRILPRYIKARPPGDSITPKPIDPLGALCGVSDCPKSSKAYPRMQKPSGPSFHVAASGFNPESQSLRVLVCPCCHIDGLILTYPCDACKCGLMASPVIPGNGRILTSTDCVHAPRFWYPPSHSWGLHIAALPSPSRLRPYLPGAPAYSRQAEEKPHA